MDWLREFFGFGGYKREPEGYLSWQHLLFVSSLMVIMISLAIVLGLKQRKKDLKKKNKVLIWSAILIDSFEIFKWIIICTRENSARPMLIMLPLFMCSIQLITIPLAAFTKGRIKEASLDFVFIFGALGAVLGTYFAGNNYASYPVISFDNVNSGITHAISGFAALYIGIVGLTSMKVKNIWISFIIILTFCVFAYIADIFIPYNYMFLISGDGTPYDLIYNLVHGNKIAYPICVVLLFLIYVSLFYLVFFSIRKAKNKKNIKNQQKQIKT